MDYLRDKLPGAHIMLLGLLPRAKGSYAQPSVLSAAIDKMNEGLR